MTKIKHLKKENKEIKMELMQHNDMKTIRRKKSKTHQSRRQKKIKENQVEDIKEDPLGMKKTTWWQTHLVPRLARNWITAYTHSYTLS